MADVFRLQVTDYAQQRWENLNQCMNESIKSEFKTVESTFINLNLKYAGRLPTEFCANKTQIQKSCQILKEGF